MLKNKDYTKRGNSELDPVIIEIRNEHDNFEWFEIFSVPLLWSLIWKYQIKDHYNGT